MSKRAAADAAIQADQIEADVWATGPRPLENALADDTWVEDDLDERFGWQAADDLADWAKLDTTKETTVDEIREEIERRQTILGPLYPFELSGTGGTTLEYRVGAGRTAVYEFCLSIATNRYGLSANPHAKIPREFERLVGRLLRKLLGPGATDYRLGWPPDEDRPGRMIDAIEQLRERTCGEFVFSQTELMAARVQTGDDGIDIVVWRPIGDQRAGKLMLLGQCACGNDWPSKLNELNPTTFNQNWGGHISRAGQLKCMAIPWHVPHPEEWTDCVNAAGILLDRCRLTWMAEHLLEESEMNEVRAHLESQIGILKTAPAPGGETVGGAKRAKVKKRKPARKRQ